ncbi:LysE family translocator [Enterovibrio sp. ZSDZ35]|uniref:LysE family translocator n=1 Tax=Enterovibrio qingdaonensis TaxID=2899818 RepID=A0ABT5QJI2_9GAMM|nr:LysE family translocator [Enterovibrio sp. ZSDZ35]MDD1781138.1 LysE family translocator [Enterovibrio sp. ZSDZ35]
MNSILWAMTVFAFVGAVTPGPVNILATSTAVNLGMRAAISHVLGASLAYAFVVFCSGSAMHVLMAFIPSMALSMKLVGSAYILYLAYKIFRAPSEGIRLQQNTKGSAWTGAVTQLINPKAWLVAMSGISLFVVNGSDYNQLLLMFTSVSLVICVIGVGVWAVIGTVLAKFLENPVYHRHFNQSMAILLGISVVSLW